MVLPTQEEISLQIRKLKNADASQIEELREWAFENSSKIISLVSKLTDEVDDFNDITIYKAKLYKYHFLNSGMVGLLEGLYEKAVCLPYKEITEASRTPSTEAKSKLTAGDRELFAKSEASDLKALKRQLEEIQRNLQERLLLLRMSNGKSF